MITTAAMAEHPPQQKRYCLRIPLDGITCTEAGRYQANIQGRVHNLAYFADVKCWFTLHETPMGSHLAYPVWRNADGQWQQGSPETLRDRPQLAANTWQELSLPALPELPVAPQPIPEVVHYIWIGDNRIPTELHARMQASAQRCPSYRFQLHAYPHSTKGWRRLQKQFPAKGRITLNDLRQSREMDRFLITELGGYFQRFLQRSTLNYGAAADILRMVLLHLKGGIYLDVDDEITACIPTGHRLLASESDILLSRIIKETKYGLDGYNNSAFACHAANPVLGVMMQEMLVRLKQANTFFITPRPWYEPDSTLNEAQQEKMLAYLKAIFFLTGPILFSDVLKKHAGASFHLERDLLEAYQALNVSPTEPRIIADDYLEAFHAAKRHYLPFSDPSFTVRIGCAHSWNPPNGKQEFTAAPSG